MTDEGRCQSAYGEADEDREGMKLTSPSAPRLLSAENENGE